MDYEFFYTCITVNTYMGKLDQKKKLYGKSLGKSAYLNLHKFNIISATMLFC
jgi:hypothetical protein